MKKKNALGQEAIEFILITVLVFCAALFVVTIFGGKLAGIFTTDSAVTKTSSIKTNVITPGSNVKYEPDYETTSYQDGEFFENPDGSTTTYINGSKVILSADLEANMNTAMEATGSAGIEELIADIQYMSEKYKIPASDVEIMMGSAVHLVDVVRTKGAKVENKKFTLDGKTEINMVCIKLGDNILVTNKTKGSNDTVSGKFDPNLKLKIEGTINPDNTFTSSNIDIKDDNRFIPSKAASPSYNTDVTITDGSLTFNSGALDLKHNPFSITSNTGAKNTIYSTGNLEIKFDNPALKFSLKP